MMRRAFSRYPLAGQTSFEVSSPEKNEKPEKNGETGKTVKQRLNVAIVCLYLLAPYNVVEGGYWLFGKLEWPRHRHQATPQKSLEILGVIALGCGKFCLAVVGFGAARRLPHQNLKNVRVWKTAVWTCALSVPSWALPVAAVGLWSLLDPDSRKLAFSSGGESSTNSTK